MFVKFRYLCVVILMLAFAAGCANVASPPEVSAVQSAEVTSQLQFHDRLDRGPAYNVTVTVPDSWVGNFEVRNVGNVVYFDYTGGDRSAEIFSIEALSPAQYWKASGSQPNSHTNLKNLGDTYFVYHLPIDAFYSGLPDAEFDELAAAVANVVVSFSAEAAQ